MEFCKKQLFRNLDLCFILLKAFSSNKLQSTNLKKLRKKVKITDKVGAEADAWEKLGLGWCIGDPAPAFCSAPTARTSELLIPHSRPAVLQS